MPAPNRIEGYAIISSDGMIADANAAMPDAFKIEADQRFFNSELNRFDLMVHGRHSHEGQANSPLRRRLVLTRRIAGLAPDPDYPKSLLWNPAGASFADACAALDLASGAVAVLGGTAVFTLFLEIGYDAFHISRAGKVKLPGGEPVFSHTRPGSAPEEALTRHGLVPGPTQVLDEAHALTLTTWSRAAAA
jgi:dihydrofolate reductase